MNADSPKNQLSVEATLAQQSKRHSQSQSHNTQWARNPMPLTRWQLLIVKLSVASQTKPIGETYRQLAGYSLSQSYICGQNRAPYVMT